jgi:mono/diheme cytochrome c family protein
MQLSSRRLPQESARRSLLLFAGVCALLVTPALAQNIDAGKSAQRLFADSCAACHRNPRGLAKGRYRPTLFLFLQDHYTTGAASAWELSSYLASIDPPQSGRSRKGASSHSTTTTRQSRVRPPASVP